MKTPSCLRLKDTRWLILWLAGISLLGLWDAVFLNRPAFKQLIAGFSNTMLIALLVIAGSLLMAWAATLLLVSLQTGKKRLFHLLITFLFNIIRSVPQIVGVLIGYIVAASLVEAGILHRGPSLFPLLAGIMSLFVFLEMTDLMLERIAHYRKSDFWDAMRVCGISSFRVINVDILWHNSRGHILNKLISILGMAVFLQCSVDFIISVGLSTDVSAVNLPVTLGSLLAKIDSKQDILAIGHTLTHPFYVWNLFFKHLQGISTAFLIVFTLLGSYKISGGFAERHRL